MLNTVLIYVLLASLLGLTVMLILVNWRVRFERRMAVLHAIPGSSQGGWSWKDAWNRGLISAYALCSRLALVDGYTARVRRKIAAAGVYTEYQLRRKTMELMLTVSVIVMLSGATLIWMRPGLSVLILILLCAVVLNSLVIDLAVQRLERRLLSSMMELFGDVRHRYQQHSMVEEALAEAAEFMEGEASLHAMQIYEALCDTDPAAALEQYYERAPNRFLKAFAGISFMVLELGDRSKKHGSIYLKGIEGLMQEIQLELLRRDRLDYLLKGLHIIALAPVLFILPIQRWAQSNFPTMNTFYDGKLGWITKLILYAIVVLAYILLQKLNTVRETGYRAGQDGQRWEEKWSDRKWVRLSLRLFCPQPGSPVYMTKVRLLRDTNSTGKVEWLYVRRIFAFLISLIVCLVTLFSLHILQKQHIIHDPVSDGRMFGRMNAFQLQEAYQEAAADYEVMHRLKMSSEAGFNEIAKETQSAAHRSLAPDRLNEMVHRIQEKLQLWNQEYMKWWEVLLCLGAAVTAYWLPVWVLYFHKKMRSLDMRHEVYQFQTILSILCEMERISVEEMLEWMNRFAVIFKEPIQKSLLHFEHGPEMALEQLREEVTFSEFQHLIDKLQLGLGRVTIWEAFDDLEGRMAFYFEQRKQEYTRIIEAKASWGRLIGFTPMYGLIFLYLVMPLIGMSFIQMNDYYDQIQKI
ncbi:hypothetical protein Q5741_00670 [Paenibacillus sp. JX-17]|uniref:Type II secretion system protein GspF domain-containing protein n=1 Tax=Paenibacillus lacisoli TaxID=3064525 RepID=A0ABT9C6Q2_9BACL|nr:hypothetical protein [Paenibacillus sp. JX-17]MDO7904921.1 hypothetical protein [Paenibacillus sp. JX-17]